MTAFVKTSAFACALLLAACQSAPDYSGKWTAPEGKVLILNSSWGGHYDVLIRNVDGERSFDGKTAPNGNIVFARNGIVESIRPATGPETGEKWLARKTDCLVVKAGEAYCRGTDAARVAPTPAPVAQPQAPRPKKWWRFWE